MAQEETIKGSIIISASAKGAKQAADATDQLAKKVKKLDKAFKENIETQDQTRAAIRKLTAAGEEAGEEWGILHKDLDRLGASMERMEQSAKDYAAATEVSEQATEEQVAASKRLKEETKEVTKFTERQNDEIREGKEAFDISKRAIQQTEIQLERFNDEQKDAFVSAKATTDAIQQEATMLRRMESESGDTTVKLKAQHNAQLQVATSLEGFTLEQKKSFVAAKSTRDAIQREATTIKLLKLESSGATVKLKAQNNAQLQLATSAAKAKLEQRFLGVEVGRLKDSLVTALSIGGVMGLALLGVNMIRDGMRRAGEAAKEFQKNATAAFSNLQEEVARTKAQMPSLIKSQEELYAIAVKTAKEVGRGTLETQVAIRKGMNLGLEYKDALDAVRLSTKAARVANADMTDTLITGMSTVNAYGRGMYDLSDVLDQYAYVTQNSNLETQDLISGMAKIISPAAEAGVSLEEVAAAMIVMNRQGDDFTEIADLLGNMLTQIAVRGTTLGTAFEQAAGMGFREFTAAGGTLVEGLILIEEEAERTGQSISELAQGNSKFYRDMLAGRGILELTGRHTEELAEAYAGATEATGTLDQQTKEFTDTLYLATEQMEAAKEEAWAVEGSLTQGLAMGWTNFKKAFFEGVTDVSKSMSVFQEINAIAGQTPLYSTIALVELARDYDHWTGLARRSTEDQLIATKAIVELMQKKETASMSDFEQAVEAALLEEERSVIREKVLKTSEEITKTETEQDQLRKMGIRDRRLAGELTKEELHWLELQIFAEESLISAAARREAFEQEVANRLLEQRKILGELYNASKGFINNISSLQEQLAASTDPEEQGTLEQQIIDAGDALDKHYKQNVIDAMIANDGYSESITDMAIAMGLITEEAGAIQKDFIRIVNEGKKLAELEGFKNLDFESQAAAAEALANGIARTAEEAFALYDPERWREGLPFGLTKAEEPFMITPEVDIPTEEMDKLTAMQEQLEEITEPAWLAVVKANTLNADAKLNLLEEKINEIVRDYEMTITINTVYNDQRGGPGGGIPELAGGGSFTVPPGYDSDNYMVGVSSGEYVTVDAPGQSLSPEGANLTVKNYFSAGVYDQRGVARNVKDSLYLALEELGLT